MQLLMMTQFLKKTMVMWKIKMKIWKTCKSLRIRTKTTFRKMKKKIKISNSNNNKIIQSISKMKQ